MSPNSIDLVIRYLRWLLGHRYPFRAATVAKDFGVSKRTAQRWLVASEEAGLVKRGKGGTWRSTVEV